MYMVNLIFKGFYLLKPPFEIYENAVLFKEQTKKKGGVV